MIPTFWGTIVIGPCSASLRGLGGHPMPRWGSTQGPLMCSSAARPLTHVTPSGKSGVWAYEPYAARKIQGPGRCCQCGLAWQLLGLQPSCRCGIAPVHTSSEEKGPSVILHVKCGSGAVWVLTAFLAAATRPRGRNRGGVGNSARGPKCRRAQRCGGGCTRDNPFHCCEGG